jgi:hypothetical protein
LPSSSRIAAGALSTNATDLKIFVLLQLFGHQLVIMEQDFAPPPWKHWRVLLIWSRHHRRHYSPAPLFVAIAHCGSHRRFSGMIANKPPILRHSRTSASVGEIGPAPT